jgi:hypothetical protein
MSLTDKNFKVPPNAKELARTYRGWDRIAHANILRHNSHNSGWIDVNRFPDLLKIFYLTEHQLQTLETGDRELYNQIINPHTDVGKRHATRGATRGASKGGAGIRHKTRGRKNLKKNKTNRRR